MIEEFGPQGFDVFAGSETFLLADLRAGGPGCITATGNVNPAAIVQLYKTAGGRPAPTNSRRSWTPRAPPSRSSR
jgi:dihydrodipicolinate synthase/N-acetylneuraminate lyase